MRVLVATGQTGESSWVFESPGQHQRQWRCVADGFVVVSPPTETALDSFVAALITHAKAHTGPNLSLVVVDT